MGDEDGGECRQGRHEQKSDRREAEDDRREDDAYGSFHEGPV